MNLKRADFGFGFLIGYTLKTTQKLKCCKIRIKISVL